MGVTARLTENNELVPYTITEVHDEYLVIQGDDFEVTSGSWATHDAKVTLTRKKGGRGYVGLKKTIQIVRPSGMTGRAQGAVYMERGIEVGSSSDIARFTIGRRQRSYPV